MIPRLVERISDWQPFIPHEIHQYSSAILAGSHGHANFPAESQPGCSAFDFDCVDTTCDTDNGTGLCSMMETGCDAAHKVQCTNVSILLRAACLWQHSCSGHLLRMRVQGKCSRQVPRRRFAKSFPSPWIGRNRLAQSSESAVGYGWMLGV